MHMHKLFIFTLIASCFCMPNKSLNKKSGNNIEITIAIDSCISLGTKNKITVKLLNKSNEDLWVNAWSLTSVLLFDSEDKPVQKFKTEEANAPDFPEFSMVKKNDSTVLHFEINFSEQYILSKENKYRAKCLYHNSVKKKPADNHTLIGDFESNAVELSICK